MIWPRRASGSAGQALPLVLVIVVLAGLGVVAIGRLAVGAVDAGRARTAADAAALAGVTGGRPAAAPPAAANGGVLVAFSGDDREVVVTVLVGTARATARATAALVRPPP
jgi:hypothetical protein